VNVAVDRNRPSRATPTPFRRKSTAVPNPRRGCRLASSLAEGAQALSRRRSDMPEDLRAAVARQPLAGGRIERRRAVRPDRAGLACCTV